MELPEAHRLLRMLTAAYPSYPVGDDTAELYLAALVQLADFGIAFDVVHEWITTQLLFPKIAELRDAYSAAVRRSHERAREKQLPEAPGDREIASRALDTIRQLYEEACADVPDHDHHSGVENCPACTTRHEREAARDARFEKAMNDLYQERTR